MKPTIVPTQFNLKLTFDFLTLHHSRNSDYSKGCFLVQLILLWINYLAICLIAYFEIPLEKPHLIGLCLVLITLSSTFKLWVLNPSNIHYHFIYYQFLPGLIAFDSDTSIITTFLVQFFFFFLMLSMNFLL